MIFVLDLDNICPLAIYIKPEQRVPNVKTPRFLLSSGNREFVYCTFAVRCCPLPLHHVTKSKILFQLGKIFYVKKFPL